MMYELCTQCKRETIPTVRVLLIGRALNYGIQVELYYFPPGDIPFQDEFKTPFLFL